MANILYETTKGYIVGVFIDTETVIPPSGYALLSEAGLPPAFIDKQIDLAGPSVKTRDYLVFTGLDEQETGTVATHGVQKYDGTTDLTLGGAGDNETLVFQLGDENKTPQSAAGFLEDSRDQLVNGAATTRLAASAVGGEETLHVRAGFLGIVSVAIDYS